jgi:hypothetical protein
MRASAVDWQGLSSEGFAMRRRQLLAGTCGLLLLGLLAGLCVWSLALPRPGITRENYERIREGMTIEEVEAVLGKHHYRLKPINPLALPNCPFLEC